MEKSIKEYLLERKQDKVTLAMGLTYVGLCLASSIYFMIVGNMRNMALAWMDMLLFPLIIGVEYLLSMQFSKGFIALCLFMGIGGGQLGPCYNFYFLIPFWDDILHTIAGVLFAWLGYTLSKRFIKGENGEWIHVLVGVLFSLSMAVVWEMIEYMGASFLGVDMQEDMLINGFNSFLLSGTHNQAFVVDGIVKTIIYYGDGQQIVLDGYLDVGLYDTLNDMVVCILGIILFVVGMWLKGSVTKKVKNTKENI